MAQKRGVNKSANGIHIIKGGWGVRSGFQQHWWLGVVYLYTFHDPSNLQYHTRREDGYHACNYMLG